MIILKERKKRLDTIAQATKLNASDLKEQAQKELLYISAYLPQPLSEAELYDEIKKIIIEINADSKKLGEVIATAKSKLGAKADGKMISDVAKKLLNI